jgi:predicted ATPase/DNA-binding CsgD family transcriptional regulator
LLGTTRLLTLTGSGGCGKTRLALQVAAGSLDQYPDGVWFVELGPLADPAFVANSVAAALGIPDQPSRPLTDTLANYLRSKTLLLVLDNCEHLHPMCQRLADHLLRASATVRIMTTSREALGVEGESIYRVPPLRLPGVRDAPPPAHLAEYDAIRLFAERAALSRPGFTITAINAPVILQICQRLDGMPLAIEFAAARVAALSVERIAARLDDRFRLLTGGPKKTLPRQQTLRATLDWSHDLLAEHEQALFRRLSVFAGGFGLEAAEKICAGNGVREHDAVDIVTHLVEKSLVVFDERDGEARYRLLESVRHYSHERLEESGEADAVQQQHRDWYLDFAERANVKLRGHEQELWLSRLETEHDNLRAALAWSKIRRDVVAWLRLTGALIWFWFINGHWGEGRRWVEDALSAGGTAAPLALFWVRWGAVLFSFAQGDLKRMRELSGNMSVPPEGMDDTEFSIMARVDQGNLAIEVGGLERGVVLLKEAVALAHEFGDQWLLAYALTQLSAGLRMQGHYDHAAGLGAESARLFEQLGDRWRLSVALREMGIALLRNGDYDNAATIYAKSLRLRAPAQNRWVVFHDLEGLACVACAQGRYARAAILFAAAVPVQESLRSRRDADFLAQVEHYLDRARTLLGEQAFEAAQNEGRAMPLEQAVEYALGPAGLEKTTAEQQRGKGPTDDPLTVREREIARLVARGLTNREIGVMLAVSERTAEGHVQHILNKLSFNSRAQIAAWAVERGLQVPSA